MTAIITADLHLNDKPRDEYRWQTCEAIIRYSEKASADICFICGDLTDDKDNHSAALVNRILELLPCFAREVYIIRGNHDAIDPDKPFFKFVDMIGDLYFVTKPTPLTYNDSRIVMLPHGSFPDILNAEGVTLILCHETFDGADGGGHRLNGKPLPKWTNPAIVSGDVHVPQKIGPVTYVGAPTLHDFGDDYEPRILKLEDNGRLISVKLRTPTKRLIEVSVTKTGVLDFPDPTSVRRGDIVKVRLIFASTPDPSTVQNCRRLAARWAERHHAELYGIEFSVPKGSLPTERSKPKPDLELVLSYAKSHGFSPETTKVGVDIVTEVLK
jgi:UDP-2,3-diacylglucosamine pyrophosphatase LpxH